MCMNLYILSYKGHFGSSLFVCEDKVNCDDHAELTVIEINCERRQRIRQGRPEGARSPRENLNAGREALKWKFAAARGTMPGAALKGVPICVNIPRYTCIWNRQGLSIGQGIVSNCHTPPPLQNLEAPHTVMVGVCVCVGGGGGAVGLYLA